MSNNGYLEPAKSSTERIEFDEVCQDGEAELKHTIIKFSNKFYILKCDKHGVHFRQNALIAAAKHLNSAFHGFMKKDFRQAIDSLGIRVVNCNDTLAKLNNDCVRHAFEMGYKPMNLLQSRYDPRSRHDTPTRPPERGLSLPAVSQQTPEKEDVSEQVLNPKPGDLYWANCPNTNKASLVIALGWKDLSMCGRDEMFCDLTLHKDMPRSLCYEFDDEGIIGWAAGYGDGESLVSSRETPVMRCESNGEDSFMWTSVRLLTPFRLNDPDQSSGANFYARIRGFDSFESMLAHQAAEDPRQTHSSIVTKSHSAGTHSVFELPSIENHSPQRCTSGKMLLSWKSAVHHRQVQATLATLRNL
ncbi:unnamed protein product [Colletotrichum noveboracense]|uniref:Uncharacterized protein n=1 Tax=Colletotrichum noveboracense TaxID=2664923 RepID=A0A9W4RZP2_9PEZI|nr:unnamed protein product [Colletotrichum noveboracense]